MEVDQHNERHLIHQYKQNGDLTLLGQLYKPYMHLVYGVCLKYFKNKDDSQDAVMQIFEQLVDRVRKHEINNFKSWLYVLTKNHCLMQLRSTQYKKQREIQEMDGGVMENTYYLHHEDEEFELESDLKKLRTCIEELQSEQKECVELFYLQKMSYKQIESQTAYELKKVKSYIQNGKRNLKNCIQNKIEQE